MGANPEFIARRAAKVERHGHKRRGAVTVEYKTWLAIKRRCYDNKFKDFPNWGGRGITVCERWRDSFDNFLADMGERPAGPYSIDRIDPDGPYSPENCRWATIEQQGAENRRGMLSVTVCGVVFQSMKAACTHHGTAYSMVMERIKAGYSPEAAILTPRRGLPNTRTRESYLPKDKR